MGKVEKGLKLDAPPEKVFDLLKDLERMPEYMPGIKEHQVLTEGPVRAGTKTKCVVEPSEGREIVYNSEVREYVENRSLGWYCPEGPKMEGLWTLDPVEGEGTRLSLAMEWELPYSLLGKLIDKLKVEKHMKANVDEGLRNLQERFSKT